MKHLLLALIMVISLSSVCWSGSINDSGLKIYGEETEIFIRKPMVLVSKVTKIDLGKLVVLENYENFNK